MRFLGSGDFWIGVVVTLVAGIVLHNVKGFPYRVTPTSYNNGG